ncbi:MAG: sigma-70 family RNA polymerase sigma factor [Candidatus Omnitrophota bacterium]|nr:sigma-70 family RNA polymerase sigma factor [Candidatus Omnitrophota bacterium]
MNDFDLVAGISRREPEAFHEVMERYAGPVVNLAYRFLGNRADAEEISQETFLRLYQTPPRLDPSSKLFTWLYRVAVNLCMDRLRKQSRTPPMDSLEDLPVASPSSRSPRETAAGTETAAAVRRAVASLPDDLRAPLVLSALEDLPHAEIANILEISPKAVERRLSRARALLKTRLQPYL